MKTSIKLYFLLIIFSTITIIEKSTAQDNTMYFMHRLPQSLETNPAVQFHCRNYIQLPVISSLQYAYNNTGFGYHDFIRHGTEELADSLILDFDNLESVLRPVNYLRSDLKFTILGAGFAYKDMFFSLHIGNSTEARVGFPRDMISFKDGNWDSDKNAPRKLDFSGLGVDVTNYTEIALGFSKQLSDRLTVGVKLKRLLGGANIDSKSTELLLNTDENPFVVSDAADYQINLSFPVEITYDSIGLVDAVEPVPIDNPLSTFVFNKNRGFAADVGIIARLNDRLTASVSAVDLGYIKWKTNVSNFQTTGDFSFMGFYFDAYELQVDQQTLWETFVDSLKNSFKFSNMNEQYRTFLTPKIFAGIDYQINDMLSVGLVTKTEIYDKKPHTSFTASLNANPTSFLTAAVSYSVINRNFMNLGLGLGIGNRGVQFYFVSDNIPLSFTKITDTPFVIPYNARTFSFRVGLNIVMDCDKSQRSGSGDAVCPAYKTFNWLR